ncbi:MAG: hypothetical protein H8D67_20525 [Deltaproteobacteria bacterium]|nr:hypothetical protein [Deltaproteobacteria bacterium]
MSKILFLAIFTFLLFFSAGTLSAGEMEVLTDRNLAVYFDSPVRSAAKQVAEMYPKIKAELESTFGWDMPLNPSVILINNSRRFEMMAESPLTVAYAVPNRNLVVIDLTKMRINPFSLENTLKHEICHLLLHYHIKGHNLPRWLDEGVCQWVSHGISDIIMNPKQSLLNKAVARGRFIPLSRLQRGFPRDKGPLLLAYEETKSFLDYITGRFGRDGLINVLNSMKKGEDVYTAFHKSCNFTLDSLEKDWHKSLKKKMPWLAHVSFYLYEILFGLMALIAVYAFIKVILRKRAYMEAEE